jgi:hypothetical protein
MRIDRVGKSPVSVPVAREMTDVLTVRNLLRAAVPAPVMLDFDGGDFQSTKPVLLPPLSKFQIGSVHNRASPKTMVGLTL